MEDRSPHDPSSIELTEAECASQGSADNPKDDNQELLLQKHNSSLAIQDGNANTPAADSDDRPAKLSHAAKFCMLTKFMLPLVITQMVPDIAEQALNRGITSLTSDDMAELLASFGLAYYVVRLFSANSIELRNISIVLVHTKKDATMGIIISVVIGLILSTFVLIIGATPLGTMLMGDLHRQSKEVTDLTCLVLMYLSPISLIEAIGSYYEGALISQRLTVYAGAAKFVDFAMQVTFTVVFLFSPTRTEPILIPIFALYAGNIGRMILDAGFWYVLVRRKLPNQAKDQKPMTVSGALRFWFPLTLVRSVQVISRPMINLVVSRSLSDRAGKKAAAEAVAVLTTLYPTGRFLFSWLNDLKTVIPTFTKATATHEKFSLKLLAVYSAFCTVVVFACNITLFMIPGVAFFIMNTIVGVNEDIANLTLTPFKIFSFLSVAVGIRAHCSGILISRKKTVYLTPSAVARLLALILCLSTLTLTELSGAVLGITCLLLSFIVEAIFVCAATLLVMFKPDLDLMTCFRCTKKPSVENEVDVPLSPDTNQVGRQEENT